MRLREECTVGKRGGGIGRNKQISKPTESRE